MSKHTTGVDFVLYVEEGVRPLSKWIKVAGQRGGTLEMSKQTHDISSKDSGNWADSIPGQNSWSLSADGLLVMDDSGFAVLEESYLQGTKIYVEMRTPANVKYEGKVIVESLSFDMANDNVATYAVTLIGAGALERVPDTKA